MAGYKDGTSDVGFETARAIALRDQRAAIIECACGKRKNSDPPTCIQPPTPAPTEPKPETVESITPEQRHLLALRQRDEELAIKAEERRVAGSWKRADLFVVKMVCEPGAFRALLSLGYQFALAHALGFVGRDTRTTRLSRCHGCTFRKRIELPVLGEVDYCHGENGGAGCGCARHPLWPFSTLDYKTSLGNFICPIGKFSRRWFDLTFHVSPWVWWLCTSTIVTGAIVWRAL